MVFVLPFANVFEATPKPICEQWKLSIFEILKYELKVHQVLYLNAC